MLQRHARRSYRATSPTSLRVQSIPRKLIVQAEAYRVRGLDVAQSMKLQESANQKLSYGRSGKV